MGKPSSEPNLPTHPHASTTEAPKTTKETQSANQLLMDDRGSDDDALTRAC